MTDPELVFLGFVLGAAAMLLGVALVRAVVRVRRRRAQ